MFLMGSSPPFLIFAFFQTIYRIKIVDFSGSQARIIGVEGMHADHETTTTTLNTVCAIKKYLFWFFQLLEERDTLQLKLSNVMRQFERQKESASRASTAR